MTREPQVLDQTQQLGTLKWAAPVGLSTTARTRRGPAANELIRNGPKLVGNGQPPKRRDWNGLDGTGL